MIMIQLTRTVVWTTLSSLVFLLSVTNLSAQSNDTTWVETLNFDDITKRRGVWSFPENNDTYRKILMYYTLKCDARTTADRFDCGEWDYLTYTTVHKHTGELDSNLLEHPLFRIGRDAPDSILYTSTPTHTTYQEYKYDLVIDNVVSETPYQIGNGSTEVQVNPGTARQQFLLTRDELVDAGMIGAVQINALRLYVKESGGMLKNFTLRMKTLPRSITTHEGFDNTELITVFQGDLQFADTGWQTMYFQESIPWLNLFGLLVDMSYQMEEGETPVVFLASENGNGVEAVSSGRDGYLLFDGTYDYIDMGNISELSGAQQTTFETWVRLDQTENWNTLIGQGRNFQIQTGPSNSLYCIVRHPGNNTHGSVTEVLGTDEWAHVAMVYDGTKSSNEERLKLYVNGEEQSLTYRGDIPSTSEETRESFGLSSLIGGTSALPGALNEARVWSVALDGSEIQEWMNKSLDGSHPNYANLLGYYPLDELVGTTVPDHSGKNRDGIMIGTPAWKEIVNTELNVNPEKLSAQPNLVIVKGTYESHLDSTLVSRREQDPPISIATYEIQDNRPVIKEVTYGWRSGYEYTYGPDGTVVDSSLVPGEAVVHNRTLEYYGEPFEVVDNYEIGRFITPYGINLTLGPDGFTWVYDVTDYAPLLRGDVDFSAGNNQELIDVRFAFIKGTPPRDVLDINRIWGSRASYRYRDLSNDSRLSAKTLPLLPEAEQFKVRTTITGHGHNSNDGNFPHCCEWKDNTHYLTVNNDKTFDWHIWQTNDCALNPVYPQGGTWPGAREGWCPGDLVKANDFEITEYVTGNEVTLDYSITPVPGNNEGMGNGNYVMAFHLFQYGAPNYTVDAEIYDLLAPNNFPGYSRNNPICADPVVVVRNNSTVPLTSLDFSYEVSGGKTETYIWNGSIDPHKMSEIVLPISNEEFWMGNGENQFSVRISNPNGEQDQYDGNNVHTSQFDMPDLYSEDLVLWYQTNLRASEFTLQIKDSKGDVIYSKENTANGTLYKDELNFPDGCYTLELTDPRNYGLSYWAVQAQGNGYIRLHNAEGQALKAFESEFGHKIVYSFSLGEVSHVQEENFEELVALVPNPAKDHVVIKMNNYELGKAEIQVFDLQGGLVWSDQANVGTDFDYSIDTRELTPGTYFITIRSDKHTISKQFVKK